jgi:hypothetical protein
MTFAALCGRVTQAGHSQVTTKTICLELQQLKMIEGLSLILAEDPG